MLFMCELSVRQALVGNWSELLEIEACGNWSELLTCHPMIKSASSSDDDRLLALRLPPRILSSWSAFKQH